MATGSDWQRLGELVSERRGDLRLTQEEVRAAGGPSTATQRLIEGGHQSRYQPRILADLEAALGWQRGSVRRILAGGDPVLVPDALTPTLLPAAPEPETPAEPAGSAEDIGDAVVTILRARQGEPGVWADLRDHLAGAGLFADDTELRAWPPGEIPAKLTPRAKQALDAAAKAGALFRDAVGDSAARLPYDWHLRVRMITQLRETARETARNPTRARRAG